MRTPFVAVLFIICLFLAQSAADADSRSFAGTNEKDRIAVITPGDRAGTRNPSSRVCETKRPARPPSQDVDKAGSKPSSAKPAFGVAMKFTRLSVKDPEAGVQWYPNHAIQANPLMKITDPRMGAAIEFLPAQRFSRPTAKDVLDHGGNVLVSRPPGSA